MPLGSVRAGTPTCRASCPCASALGIDIRCTPIRPSRTPAARGGRDEQGFRITGLLSSAERIEFGLIIRVVDRARRGGSIGGDERWRERKGAGSEEPDHLEAPREGLSRELVRLVARGAEELGVLLLGPRWVEDPVGDRQRLG